jgi:hypothetical protein
MSRLEQLIPGASVRGLLAGAAAKVVQAEWFGDQAVKVTFEEPSGAVRNRLVYRSDEGSLELVGSGPAWSFAGDGYLFRLASEAQRIRLAYLFEPYLALSTSLIEPLPHQITAVYGEMLPRQPLRFLLADDPGVVIPSPATASVAWRSRRRRITAPEAPASWRRVPAGTRRHSRRARLARWRRGRVPELARDVQSCPAPV